jgi:hypothetical protein
MNEHPVRVLDPESSGVEAARWRRHPPTLGLDLRDDRIETICAEADMMEALARVAAKKDERRSVLPGATQLSAGADLRDVHSRVAIKVDALVKVRHFQCNRQYAQYRHISSYP